MDHLPADALAWISFGGNVGDTRARFARVVEKLTEISMGTVLESPIHRSEPWGGIEQAPFLNQVVAIEPRLSPAETLKWLIERETEEGRDRSVEVR